MPTHTFVLKVESNDGTNMVLVDANNVRAITYTAETPEEFVEVRKFKVGDFVETSVELPEGKLTMKQIVTMTGTPTVQSEHN